MKTQLLHLPKARGLYHPNNEKENCGIGFIAHIKGKPSNQITLDALEMLSRMEHRGGCGCETNTGDGAGILTNIPHEFFIKEIKRLFGVLVEKGTYSVGNIFLPQDKKQRVHCMDLLEKSIVCENQTFIGWRNVPINTNKANIGNIARKSQPVIKQLIITRAKGLDTPAFERALFIIRKHTSNIIRTDKTLSQALLFYICSMSSNIIIYKGMLLGSQVLDFYQDLSDIKYSTYLAMVHSRFSTNTFPSWDRAQPCRYMSHNGEINTRQGNYNWMHAREGVLKSKLFKNNLNKILPVIETEVSDSGSFDNVLEFLMMNGRTLQEAALMMVPEAWQNDNNMSAEKKAFYEYLSNIMEPWDGPASIAFTDGFYIGAMLDRNGLRPSRYYITHDERVIMASEVGVVDVATNNIKTKGRLRPGKMFLVDFSKGKLVDDETIKSEFAAKNPYQAWLNIQQIHLSEFHCQTKVHSLHTESLIHRLKTFGYSTETLQFMLLPLVNELRDPVGSMGNDSALACLSSQSRIIYDYFKQLFAQVTNPAIDSIREEVVMSLRCSIGPEGNLLHDKAENAHRLVIEHPILTNKEVTALKHCNHRNWTSKTIDITYDINKGKKVSELLDDICTQGSQAIKNKNNLIILSDRNIDKNRVAISSLLASSALHRHLVASTERTQVGIIVETGEAREVHHFCLMVGFGADAINPYLAFEALWQARRDEIIDIKSDDAIISSYRKSIAKGMLKVMAKMGISTLESYKGAQIFEAVGLAPEIMDKCFFGTASRINGVNFDILQTESEKRHQNAYQTNSLDNFGQYYWRSGGEKHMWDPQTISNLQNAARNNNKSAYLAFSKHANEQGTRNSTLRGLMSFKKGNPISIDNVENIKEIVKRFATGAMSFGSISSESHESLAIAMNRLGGKSNTGEGGEDKKRWTPDINGDSRRSAIKQVASGRFGVTIDYLNNADEIQIKISQGAKPGEGGELPGAKVDENIASIRHSTPGVGLISPPPHHDIYSIEDLSQLIFDLKHSNPSARISVKLVAEIGVGTIAAGVVKAKSDHIVIAGHDGGTGASPLTSIKHAGLPWELGLAETHQTLVMNGLRSRIVIQIDGQLKTGRDVAIGILLGAEEFGFSTAPLITLGCIMMRKCHLNTCPVGIATQDTELRKKFTGKPEHVVNYLFMVAQELRLIMAELGFKTINEMIGRVDMLQMNQILNNWKQGTINLDALLTPAKKPNKHTDTYQTVTQDHQLDQQIDNKLITKSKLAVKNTEKIHINSIITNVDRAVGTMLSSYIVKTRGANNLQDNTIHISFKGSAGQSLGAFLAKGVTLEVEGDANDYVGKGISGGCIIVYPPKNSTFHAENEIIAGNVCGYGATAGEIYLSGCVSERFCVRNSGAIAVVEGIGDHGCEYMTGGRAIILGEVGRNFGAGMSGGIAYIYNPHHTFESMANLIMIDLDPMDNETQIELKQYINNHAKYTESKIAIHILDNWHSEIKHFIKIMPKDFKRVLSKKITSNQIT
ncbi:glutamate synthase large subunit [Candidatus Vesicomyidisocius sp. SY067_SCS001]|uniref:glutamate synthase large subunit n=1 Tax=Candidatus Vesicomyidisocius sp. SY067_SCS001 TaxID=2732590 RepID=UPI001689072D|nr:glutamate synthase large subunit [Candidatus Vesicomyosocius sp. SY067_SCS001]